MTTRPEPEPRDTIVGTTRYLIGITRTLGKKAVEDIDLQPKEALLALDSIAVLIGAYEQLVGLRGVNGFSPEYAGLGSAEREDYRAAKHYVKILRGLYGPQDVPAS